MLIPVALMSGRWLELATLPFPPAFVFILMRAEKMATHLRRTVVLYSRDLDGFLSLCLARLIVWRHIRNRH